MGPQSYDLVIVGGGPAGLAAGSFAVGRGLRTLVLEAGQAGGQLTALYPEKPVYNIPAVSGTTAGEYAARLIEQARAEGVEFIEGEGAKRLCTANGAACGVATCSANYRARAVILASGAGLMEPRKLGVQGEEALAGRSLFYAVRSPRQFAGKRILVVGGGDTAVDNALLLSELASEVVLAHRSPTFRAAARNLSLLSTRGVAIHTSTQIARLEGENGQVEAELHNSATGERRPLLVDAIVVCAGMVPNPGPVADWGLRMEGKQVVVDSEMKTSLPGLYACGDVVSYPGKLKLVVTAIGEAATAVNSAFRYLKEGIQP